MTESKNKTIELWDGYEVEVDTQLLKDADYFMDMDEARAKGDTKVLISMMFALVGGEKTYEATREKITEQYGYFNIDELLKIVEKIGDCFPKAGNRASRRQKWITR